MMCVVILCLILSVGSAAPERCYRWCIDGIMDLREWNSQADKSIELTKFYWGFLEPHELESQRRQDKKYINVRLLEQLSLVESLLVGMDLPHTINYISRKTRTTAIRLLPYIHRTSWVNNKLVSEQGGSQIKGDNSCIIA